MSRQDQFVTKTNPATVTIEWAGSGSDGFFKFWNKETRQDVRINELSFAVLAERSCVRGWMEEKKSNAYSNEVSSLKNQTLTVKYFQDGKPRELCSGKYAELHDSLVSQGIKFNKVIYVMVIESDALESGTIAKVLLKGAASGAWMNFKDKRSGVKSDGFSDGKKGAVKYRTPKFSSFMMEEGDNEEAEMAYEQVKAYLSTAPATTVHAEHDDVPDYVIDEQEDLVPADDDAIPF
jgi:hypothetical protein